MVQEAHLFEEVVGDVPNCPKCKKTVFMAEARVAGKFKWHANCFKCRESMDRRRLRSRMTF